MMKFEDISGLSLPFSYICKHSKYLPSSDNIFVQIDEMRVVSEI